MNHDSGTVLGSNKPYQLHPSHYLTIQFSPSGEFSSYHTHIEKDYDAIKGNAIIYLLAQLKLVIFYRLVVLSYAVVVFFFSMHIFFDRKRKYL